MISFVRTNNELYMDGTLKKIIYILIDNILMKIDMMTYGDDKKKI